MNNVNIEIPRSSKLEMNLKQWIRATFAAAALGLLLLTTPVDAAPSPAKGKAATCLWNKTITVNGQTVCAYDLSVAFYDHRTKGPGFLGMWTDLVAHGMNVVTGGVFDLPGLLRNEIRPGRVVMKPTAGHEGYQHCGSNHLVAGINDARAYPPVITETHGTWSWHLPRQGFGEGRNWYMGHWAWVSHHPAMKPDTDACNDTAQKAVNAMEKKRLELEAKKRVAKESRPWSPHWRLPH